MTAGGLMNILAITTMRNEGPHCLEWFAHHLAAGVGHFLVYSNDCDDGTDAMLDLLGRAGLVTHQPLAKEPGKSVQWQAFRHAAQQALYQNADWVLVTDCDEFINLRPPLRTLQDLISTLPKADAVAMRWRLFGNSGRLETSLKLTVEAFDQAAAPDIALPLAHFFKSLFRPAAFRQIGVHRPKKFNGSSPVWVDGSGQILAGDFAKMDSRINLYGHPVSADLVQLNHYSLRAAENFMLKRARGLPNHMQREIGLGYWVERNFNSVQDSSIAPMIAATKARLAALLDIPGLADLHSVACSIHRKKFESLMENRHEAQLYWQLLLSGSSQPPTPRLARAHVDRLAKTQ